MRSYTILEAPSCLGLRPTGVERLPDALRAAGLADTLGADRAGRLEPPAYDPARDPTTGLRNGPAIRDYSRRLADALGPLVRGGRCPLVLGGDCSVLIGALLGLRRLGRYGLFFIDGHADFYQPEAEPYGEVASMELGLVSGRGPAVLADIDGLRPLVRDEDIVAFGYRDGAVAAREGSRDIADFPIRTFSLARVRSLGVGEAAAQALAHLRRDEVAGFWVHLDADVLDDAVMPAVDYRMPGGLAHHELAAVLRALFRTGRAAGMTVTIYNPALDPDGAAGRGFADAIAAGLVQSAEPGTEDRSRR